MIRNLKALGLAMAAVFAFSAVVASAASAQGTFTSDGTVTLSGTETGAEGSGLNALTAFGGKTECPGSTISGSSTGSLLTLTPSYKNCFTIDAGGSKFSTTVDLNECDLQLKATSTAAANTYNATGFEVCPEGKHIQVTLFSSASHALRVCTLTTTAPPGGVTGGHITNTPGAESKLDDIDVTGTFGNFKVDKSGLCGSATTEEGKLDIDGTIKGLDGEGNATGLRVSD